MKNEKHTVTYGDFFGSNEIQSILRHFQLLEVERSYAINLTKSIHRWFTNNGSDYVVERLKSVKLAFIHYQNGEKDYAKHLSWVSTSRRNGKVQISGIFKPLFKSNLSRKEMKRTLSILNTYYAFMASEKKTKSDIVELIATIERAPLDDRLNTKLGTDEKIREAFSSRFKGSAHTLLKQCMPFRTSIKSNKVELSLAGYATSKPKGYGVVDQPWIDSLLSTRYEYTPWMEYLDMSDVKPNIFKNDSYYRDGILGKASYLQQAGGKTRPIAVPISEAQIAFRPLHQALARLLKDIPADCTFDQDSGAHKVQEWLNQGKTCHSIDLKSATDRFPRKLQLSFAKACGIDGSWLNAFDNACKLPFEYEDKLITYKVGQPMGLYGSFPLLSLGQHGLIHIAAYNLGISPNDKYVVLGDDIVINDTPLAREYEYLLGQFEIPISHHKCVTGDTVAEFAGFIITKNGAVKGAKPSLEWDKLELGSLLNYCKVLEGIPSSLPLKYKINLQPLVYLPLEYDGLGFNPLGISLTEMEKWMWSHDHNGILEMDSKMSYDRIKSQLYSILYSNVDEHGSVYPELDDLLSEIICRVEVQWKTMLKGTLLREHSTAALDHYAINDNRFLLGVVSDYTESKVSLRWIRNKYPNLPQSLLSINESK